MSYDDNITEIINIQTRNDSNSSKSSKDSTVINLVGSVGNGVKDLGKAAQKGKIGVKEAAAGLKIIGGRMGLATNTVDIVKAITSDNPEYEIPKAVAKMGGSMALGSATVGLLSGIAFSNPLTAAIVIFTTAAVASYAGSEGVDILFDKLFKDGLPITDDPTIPNLTISNPIISEKSDVATFNIKLRQPLDYDLELRVRTNNGSAKSGKDYIGIDDVITIKAGDTSYKYDVKIVDDTEIEVAENFSLSVQSINKTDGNDILIGGFGKDTLIGGSGIDIYKADKFDAIIDSDKKVA